MACTELAPCCGRLRVVLVTPERIIRQCLNGHSFVELRPVAPVIAVNRPFRPSRRPKPGVCLDCCQAGRGLRCQRHCAACRRAMDKRCRVHGGLQKEERKARWKDYFNRQRREQRAAKGAKTYRARRARQLA